MVVVYDLKLKSKKNIIRKEKSKRNYNIPNQYIIVPEIMQRTCKQCGKEFTITQNEIRFYKSKHLNLPRRCEECRKKNKGDQGIKEVQTVGEKKVNVMPQEENLLERSDVHIAPTKETSVNGKEKQQHIVPIVIAVILVILIILCIILL